MLNRRQGPKDLILSLAEPLQTASQAVNIILQLEVLHVCTREEHREGGRTHMKTPQRKRKKRRTPPISVPHSKCSPSSNRAFSSVNLETFSCKNLTYPVIDEVAGWLRSPQLVWVREFLSSCTSSPLPHHHHPQSHHPPAALPILRKT